MVTSSTGFQAGLQRHVVNVDDLVRLAIGLPQDFAGLCIPDRRDSTKVAGLTAYAQVRIVNSLLIVPVVAFQARGTCARCMTEFRRLRVTDKA